MIKIAVFAGSFDPVTRGHEAVIRKACNLFDKVIVGVGTNTTKNALFPLEKRILFLEETFKEIPQVEVLPFSGLTIDFCRSQNARFLLRGLRSSPDFEYERNIALMNKTMAPDIETIFLLTEPEFTAVSSTIVREILRFKGDISAFVPAAVNALL
jgi:pantetheine-phosphate adenylyltransferase